MSEHWALWCTKNNWRIQMSGYSTKQQAEDALQIYRDDDEKGCRPDLHDKIPFWEARRIV